MSLLFVRLRLLNNRRFSQYTTCFQKIYSSQEKEYILSKINEKDLPSKGLSSNYVQKIYQHVEEKKLNNLEELLAISGIGPKVLRKICDSILCNENDSVKPASVKKKLNLVTPTIDDIQKKELIYVAAIHIGVDCISWTLINSITKELLEWDSNECRHEKRNLYESLLLIENVASLIPNANIYVMEDMGGGRNQIDYYRTFQTAILSSFLRASRRKEVNSPVVAFLKSTVKNKMYNGFVGSEKVSLQNHVLSIIEERSLTDCIYFPKEIKDKFYSMKNNTKEEMAQALLLATSFINIVLNQRPMNKTNSVKEN